MKTTTLIPALLLWVAGIAAETKPKIPLALEKALGTDAPKEPASDNSPEKPVDRFEVFAAFARGNKLVGYNDPRYLANDKTDYLKSDAMTANLEFTVRVPYRVRSGGNSALADIFDGVDFLRFGGQVTGWSVLTGPGISIPKTGAPISAEAVSASINAASRPGLGFFFGIGKNSFEVDLGLTVSLAFANEGSRTKYVTNGAGTVQTDGSGNYLTEQAPGRGMFISDAFVLPTFRFVWGQRNNMQFFVSAGREQFEFQRDYLQTYFRLPVAGFFKLDLGVGLFPNATLFLQPNFEFGRLMIGLRGGIALNYYVPELRRVGLSDSLYVGVSVSGRF